MPAILVLVSLGLIVQGELDQVSQTITQFVVKRGDALSLTPEYKLVKRVTSACKTQQGEMLDNILREGSVSGVEKKLIQAAR